MSLPDRIRAAVADVEPTEALGALETVRAELWARAVTPKPQPNGTPPEADQFLRASEVADRLGVSPRFVYDHEEELGAVRLSPRKVVFRESAVARFLRRREAQRS